MILVWDTKAPWLSGFCSLQGSSEGAEQASRGKIVLLKKKVEELEQQLAQRVEELENKVNVCYHQRRLLESPGLLLSKLLPRIFLVFNHNS